MGESLPASKSELCDSPQPDILKRESSQKTGWIDDCGCSSVVEHNLAKVGVVGSNPIARSRYSVMCFGGRSRGS